MIYLFEKSVNKTSLQLQSLEDSPLIQTHFYMNLKAIKIFWDSGIFDK